MSTALVIVGLTILLVASAFVFAQLLTRGIWDDE